MTNRLFRILWMSGLGMIVALPAQATFEEIQARHQRAQVLEVMEYLLHHPDAPDSEEALQFLSWNEPEGLARDRFLFGRNYARILTESAPLHMAARRLGTVNSIMESAVMEDESLVPEGEKISRELFFPWLTALLKNTESMVNQSIEFQMEIQSLLISICWELDEECPLKDEFRKVYIPHLEKTAFGLLDHPDETVDGMDLSDLVSHEIELIEFAGGGNLAEKVQRQWVHNVSARIAKLILPVEREDVPPAALALLQQLCYLTGDEAEESLKSLPKLLADLGLKEEVAASRRKNLVKAYEASNELDPFGRMLDFQDDALPQERALEDAPPGLKNFQWPQADADPVSLGALNQTAVFLFLWNPAGAADPAWLAELKRLSAAHKADAFSVVVIAAGCDADKARQFKETFELPWVVLPGLAEDGASSLEDMELEELPGGFLIQPSEEVFQEIRNLETLELMVEILF